MQNSILSLKAPIPHLNKVQRKMFQEASSGSLPAGITYLGQLLAHEIVSSTSKKHITRTPVINLESIYGTQPNNGLFDRNGLFVLGGAVKADGSILPGLDLPIDPATGKAKIADERNDENIFISQLHLLWMRLHNCLVKELRHKPIDFKNFDKGICDIRDIVSEIFKIVIIEDFICHLIHPKIVDGYRNLANSSLMLSGFGNYSSVPDIFSMAAFRFGHSMVRSDYQLRPSRSNFSVPLAKLFRHRSGKDSTTGEPVYQVSEELLFDWDMIFGEGQEEAMRIDPYISKDMRRIPFGCRHANVVESNLAAGFYHNLPSARALYDEIQSRYPDYIVNMDIQAFDPDQVNHKRFFPFFERETLPIWLYFLTESYDRYSLFPGDDRGTGIYLGILGSIVNMEVLINAFGVHGLYFFQNYLKDKSGVLNGLGVPGFTEFIRQERERVGKEPGLGILDIVNYCHKSETENE